MSMNHRRLHLMSRILASSSCASVLHRRSKGTVRLEASACSRKIPFMLYRSGTSRGPYFIEKDVPPKGPERDKLLVNIMGSGHPQQLEGIGGGIGVTSKAVIVGPGEEDGTVTYTFAQCRVEDASVDHSHGDCGNMLAAVAPFAIERGLVEATAGTTHVKIHSRVTGALYAADVLTSLDQDGRTSVHYNGDYVVTGVPGAGAAVVLTTFGVTGSQTGKLLPTGNSVDKFGMGDGLGVVSATVVDFARALIILDADEVLPKFGYGSIADATKLKLEGDIRLNKALDNVRREASLAIGMGDCRGKDAPKIAIVGKCVGKNGQYQGGIFASRYWVNPERSELHPTMAMTAAQALAAAALLHGSIVSRHLSADPRPDELQRGGDSTFSFGIAHLKGVLPVTVGVKAADGANERAFFRQGVPDNGKYTTTVRPIAEGHAFA